MNATTRKSLKNILINSTISGVITALFMYLLYYAGPESIFAGFGIGFSVYLCIVAYKQTIEKRYLRKLNLLLVLLLNTTAQVFIILVLAFLFVGIFYMNGHFELYWQGHSASFIGEFMIGLAFGLVLSMVFSFLSIVSTLIGKNILTRLFIGKYRKPLEEYRVFMFLDITASTTIAEKIGHLKFLSLLNDFFYDIVEPISMTHGEIYKYVGDEVIITWKKKDGTRDLNCIRCFYEIDRKIKGKAAEYEQKYGLVPDFKAGLHCGISVTGELGYTRREIAYVGDILNTTARIKDECKNFNQRLLVSEDLVNQLDPHDLFQAVEVGTAMLRGKEKGMKLFTAAFFTISQQPV